MRSAALHHDDVRVQARLPQPAKDSPLRLLLIREKRGDLPWVVKTIQQVMAPVDLVQVCGLGNAIWRLGHERFDSVLLDLEPRHRQAIDVVRRHIADVAAVPVLDLHEDQIIPTPRETPAPVQVETRPVPTRTPAPAAEDLICWPPKAGQGAKRRPTRPRVRAPFLAAVAE